VLTFEEREKLLDYFIRNKLPAVFEAAEVVDRILHAICILLG